MESTLGNVVRLLLNLGLFGPDRHSFIFGEYVINFVSADGGHQQIRVRRLSKDRPVYQELYTFDQVRGHWFAEDGCTETEMIELLTVLLMVRFPFLEAVDLGFEEDYLKVVSKLSPTGLIKTFGIVGKVLDSVMYFGGGAVVPPKPPVSEATATDKLVMKTVVDNAPDLQPLSDELELLYPASLAPLSLDKHYIPSENEPDPFGSAADWYNWAAFQPIGYTQGRSPKTFRTMLCDHLEKEPPRTMADLEDVPCGLKTRGGSLSLGYIIHIRYTTNMSWPDAVKYAQAAVKRDAPAPRMI